MRNYKQSNEKIEASDELIYKTIRRIKEKKGESIMVVKRLVIGVAAMVILAFSGVATYAAITKDTRILEFFGIKLSQNYETEAKEKDVTIKTKQADIHMKSFAIDQSFVTMEYEVKLDKKLEEGMPKLKINEISIYSPYIEKQKEELASEFYNKLSNYIPFEFEVKQVAEEIEENEYHIFVIAHVKGLKEGYEFFTPHAELGLVESPNAYASYNYHLLDYAYGKYEKYNEQEEVEVGYDSDTAKFKVVVEAIENEKQEKVTTDLTENGVIELEINRKELQKQEKCDWKFYTEKIEKVSHPYYEKEGYMWKVENKMNVTGTLTRGSFANIINVNVWEEEAMNTDIDKIQIKIKNQEGTEIKAKFYEERTVTLDDNTREIFFTFVMDEETVGQQYTIEIQKEAKTQRQW